MIDARAPEGRRLEYKAELPGPTDAAKKEFLKDVTSFANTVGGTLLYGVEGERDAEGKTTGAPRRARGLKSWNRDQLLQRLDNLLLAGVSPRLFGVRFTDVPGFADGPILAVDVEKSWGGPHRVTLGGAAHFYARNDGGVYPMDVNELRQAFLGSSKRAERVRQFRQERLRVVNGEEPVVRMVSGAKMVLHLFPLDRR